MRIGFWLTCPPPINPSCRARHGRSQAPLPQSWQGRCAYARRPRSSNSCPYGSIDGLRRSREPPAPRSLVPHPWPPSPILASDPSAAAIHAPAAAAMAFGVLGNHPRPDALHHIQGPPCPNPGTEVARMCGEAQQQASAWGPWNHPFPRAGPPHPWPGAGRAPWPGWHGGGVASVVRRVAIVGSSWKGIHWLTCHLPHNQSCHVLDNGSHCLGSPCFRDHLSRT